MRLNSVYVLKSMAMCKNTFKQTKYKLILHLYLKKSIFSHFGGYLLQKYHFSTKKVPFEVKGEKRRPLRRQNGIILLISCQKCEN